MSQPLRKAPSKQPCAAALAGAAPQTCRRSPAGRTCKTAPKGLRHPSILLLSLLLACISWQPSQLAAAAVANLLDNPGLAPSSSYTFSSNGGNISGTLPRGWTDNTEWAGPGIAIRYSLHGGATCGAGITGGCIRAAVSKGFMQLGQFLEAPAGANYRLAIKLRATTAAGLPVQLQLRQTGAPYIAYGQALTAAGSDWLQLEIAFAHVPPTAATPGSRNTPVFFAIISGGPGILWLAEPVLQALPPGVAAPVVQLAPPAAAVLRAFFCLNTNHVFESGTTPRYLWPALDFGTWRSWDSGLVWATIQPIGRGLFNWSRMDAAVTRAAARRQQVLFTLGQTPSWASSNPTEPSVYGPGRGSPPRSVADWRAFVAAMARRYRGHIHAYEVWNEPDIQGPEGFYNGSPESLAALEAATAAALAEEDPSALLLTPPMSGGNGATQLGFLARYLKAGGGKHAQAVAWHAYVAAPEAGVNGIEALRQLLKVHGLSHLPIWNTEGGLSLDQVGPNSRFAAGFVARSMLVDWALGLQRSCWYAYDNTAYEGLDVLVATDQTNPLVLNPAGRAYQQTMAWLLGARMLSMAQRTDGIWVAELALPAPSAARRAWAVWCPAGTKSFKFPARWQAAYWQDASNGALIPLEAGVDSRVQVGVVPLLIASYAAS